ncbi:hypothetical protein M9Y10_044972 [Tritrichomonas musculus]|uniref:Uncharacterized protein n=1 Tax=Tritrichomonas musculus TaxID=1915356 RepID=A0ABR2JTX0_9EUKA
MAYFYYKESTKNFPPLGHPLLPPLFIEAGKMPTHNPDKTKSCIILVNLAGIYFLRPVKLQKTYKISKFLSSFSITEIIYQEKKRTILARRDSVYIQSPHMDDAIISLVSARKFLLQRLYEKNAVKFTNFPFQPNLNMSPPMNASLLILQYICYCIQHEIPPDDNGIIPIFQKYDFKRHSILTFNENCIAPIVLKCLSRPLLLLDTITTLHFKNFAPYSACRIIHKVMRHQLKYRNIILDGYLHLVPEQLRLKKLSPKSIISIVIQNCRLPEETLIRFFDEFTEFNGEVQRLSLKNIVITGNAWKDLLNVLTTCRAFRTLEIFELENIEGSQLYEDQINEGLQAINKHCRFIQKFSISSWSQPQLYASIEPFFANSFLYELILKGQNITQPFSESTRLPRCIHHLDFSRCNFTIASLKSLFTFLSKTPDHIPISLGLADIVLPSTQWRQFYQELSSVNQINFITELDWSGNAIDPNYINDMVSYFFTLNPIRFLSVDRIFGNNKIQDFNKFFSAIPHGKLKGLSIGGSIEQNFSGNFSALLKGINPVCPISILHLVGQKMQPEDIQPFLNFMNENSTLCEIFIDDTSISNGIKFCELYDHIFGSKISIIGRPEIDLNRLFGPNSYSDNNRDDLSQFRERITKYAPASSKSIRSFFFSRNEFHKDFDQNQYITFVQRFPTIFYDPDDIDPFQLQYKSPKPSFPSLLVLGRLKLSVKTLSDLHAACLVEPMKLPPYSTPVKTKNEAVLESGYNDYDTLNNYMAMNQLSSIGGSIPFSLDSMTSTHVFSPSSSHRQIPKQEQSSADNIIIDQKDQQQQQPSQFYDQQFTPDPDFLNKSQKIDLSSASTSENLYPAFDSQFVPDPYFLQSQTNNQFQQLEPQQALQPLEPLQPIDQLPPQQLLQPLEPLQPQQPLMPLEPLQPLDQLPPQQSLQPLDSQQPLKPLEPQQPLQPLESQQPLQPLEQQNLEQQNLEQPQLQSLESLFQQTQQLNQNQDSSQQFNLNSDFQFELSSDQFKPFNLEEPQFAPDPNFIPSSEPFNHFDSNEEYVPAYIPDPNIDLMIDPNGFNSQQVQPNPPINENLNIAPPPPLQETSDDHINTTNTDIFATTNNQQPLVLPSLDSFQALQTEPIPQQPPLQSSVFIPPLEQTASKEIQQTEPFQQPAFIPQPEPLTTNQYQQQSNQEFQQHSFIPPPIQSQQNPQFESLQQHSFIPPPIQILQPNIEDQQQQIIQQQQPPQIEHPQHQIIEKYEVVHEEPAPVQPEPQIQQPLPQAPPIEPLQQHSFIPPPIPVNPNQSPFIPPPFNPGQMSQIPPPLRASATPAAPPPLIPPPINSQPKLTRDTSSQMQQQDENLSQDLSLEKQIQMLERQNELLEKERERIELRKRERERIEREKREKEKIESEKHETGGIENEKLEKDRIEKERLERERLEHERLEHERLEHERLEKERLEKERIERERIELERLENERRERERIELEKRERERIGREQSENDLDLLAQSQAPPKRRGFSYIPNQPRRGPPVMLQKMTLITKKVVKKNRFPSAAGLLDLPRAPSYSRQPITPGPKTVNIPQSGQVSIPSITELPVPQAREKKKSFDDFDIPDLITYKSKASTNKLRDLTVFDHKYENDILAFYENPNGMPFKLLQTTPQSSIVVCEMTHPLQTRRRNQFPHVTILGVPSEW